MSPLYSIDPMPVPVFERRTLGNGLRVITAPLDHAQSVACFVMLAAGSRYERAENRGIAHFAEHMFFKGTERRPTSRDLTTIVDGIGGEFNAFTSNTRAITCAARRRRDTAFDVLLDMLRHSKFDPEEIDRESDPRGDEMYNDTPRDHIENYETLIFGDNPLGWEILGTKDSDPRRDARDVPRPKEWYTPERDDRRGQRWSVMHSSRCSKSCSATCRRTASATLRRLILDPRPDRTSMSTTRMPTRRT